MKLRTTKLITYYAEATGVVWFAVRNKTHITPWCRNPLRAWYCFYKKDLIEIDDRMSVGRMTREQAIEMLKNTLAYDSDFAEAKQLAIKALEQETVPRESYHHVYCLRKEFEMKVDELEKKITEQVPTKRTGEWTEHKHAEIYDGLLQSNFECSECHDWLRDKTDYCPSCGAEMKA